MANNQGLGREIEGSPKPTEQQPLEFGDSVLLRPNWWARHANVLLLGFTVLYLLIFSEAIPTFIDEASSFYLATDKSLSHLFAALRGGADGSFPVYAIIVYGWEKLFGSSELSLRLNSGLFILLFVWHSGKRLQQHFGPAAVVLALLFVLANKIFTFYALQARFYGLVIFLFSLCYWSTWDLLQTRAPSNRKRLWHALICGLLCLSHPMGLVYAAILGAAYLVLALTSKRWSLPSTLTFLGGPLLFLIWLPSFIQQRIINPTYTAGAPGWRKYWTFAFFDSLPLFLTLLGGAALVFFLRRLPKSASVPEAVENQSSRSLVVYSLMFVVLLNATLALLDAIHVMPVYWMPAIRYLVVCWIPYATIIAAIVTALSRLESSSPKLKSSLTRVVCCAGGAGLLVLMTLNWGDWFKGRSSDKAYFSKISNLAAEKHLEVVCASYWDAFYLATRTSTSHTSYLLDEAYPFKCYLLQLPKYYPAPTPVCPPAKLHMTNDFLFLTESPREAHIVAAAPKTN